MEKERIHTWETQETYLATFNGYAKKYEVRPGEFARRPVPGDAAAGYLPRLRPGFCILFLNILKKSIEKHGPQEDVVPKMIDEMYGKEKTLMAESLSVLYAALVRNKGKEDDHSKVWREGCLTRILDLIAKEIKSQEFLDHCESRPEVLAQAVDYVELPPQDVLDRIQRYFTANARTRFRMLQELEIVRRLKPKPPSGRRNSSIS